MNASNIIIWLHKEQMEQQKELFFHMSNMPNAIEAVDGTFIPIRAPNQDAEVYITRKCNYAITMQAITNVELKFTDVFVGYTGSVNDTHIFQNDKHILGNKAYTSFAWCVKP